MLSSETVLPYAVLTLAAISLIVRSPSMALSTRCSSWVNWMTWPSARLTSAGGIRYPDPCDRESARRCPLVRGRRPNRAQRRPTPSGSGPRSWGVHSLFV